MTSRQEFNETCAAVSERLIVSSFAAFRIEGDENLDIRQALLSEALQWEEYIMNGDHQKVPAFLLKT